jgi:hypothetical protein
MTHHPRLRVRNDELMTATPTNYYFELKGLEIPGPCVIKNQRLEMLRDCLPPPRGLAADSAKRRQSLNIHDVKLISILGVLFVSFTLFYSYCFGFQQHHRYILGVTMSDPVTGLTTQLSAAAVSTGKGY